MLAINLIENNSILLVAMVGMLFGITGCALWNPDEAGDCKHCGKHLYTFNESIAHAREVHNVQEACPICRSPFNSQREFFNHLKKQHPARYRAMKKGEEIRSIGIPIK
jgi:hypothetical protein